MTSVKNMSRRQQKAVFANLGNKPSSVSNMSARRESLMRNDLTNETKQDKIDRIMRDSKLTHRQKMDRIARLKSRGSLSSTVSNVPTVSSSTRVESPGVRLIYQKVLDKAEKRRLARKAYLKEHPGAVFTPTKTPGLYLLKEDGHNYTWTLEKGRTYALTSDQKKIDKVYKKWKKEDTAKWVKTLPDKKKKEMPEHLKIKKDFAWTTKGTYEKVKNPKPEDVKKKDQSSLDPDNTHYGWGAYVKKHSEGTTPKKEMSYKELKAAGVPLKPNKDYDKDGVKNSKDCRPMNRKKQDLWSEVGNLGYSAAKAGARSGAKFYKKQAYAHSAEGRAKIAQAKIDKIEAKEQAQAYKTFAGNKAEQLEKRAKEREAAYKRKNPSLFSRVLKRKPKKSIYD